MCKTTNTQTLIARPRRLSFSGKESTGQASRGFPAGLQRSRSCPATSSENDAKHPTAFTLNGFADQLEANGTYIHCGVVHGKPAFAINADADRWCCYVAETDEWQIQTTELKV